jgi:LacI family transcriptional regulator, repressor for deo operon, udp, cdd, tsx, nupC, and nupG
VVESRPPANMADVAHAAGVSVSTVSRALRGKPGVSTRMREHIRSTAADLSYVVSADASALARRSTHRVGVVVPHIGIWFFSTMLAGIESRLREADLDVLVFHVEGEEDRRRFFEHLPVRRKVDAVIVVAMPVTGEQVARLGLMGVHVVVAGGRLGGYPHVRIDDVAVGRRAVEHLVDLGHRSIAMVRSRDHEGVVWPADEDRTKGYRQALRSAGLQVRADWLITEQWGVHGGRLAVRRLLRRRRRPTALFVYSDETAFGALDELRRNGVDVPGDMSLVSVDDHPHADLHGLTTIRQPVHEQGACAARITLGLLRGEGMVLQHEELGTELVVRETTAALTTPATTG